MAKLVVFTVALTLRAVLADLKAEGWDPASISNRSKCELGERLRRATALPLRSITGFLRISKSSYEYWRPRVAAPRDRDADIRDRVVRIFREGSGCWGYRTVWARLRREGVRASEKRVARVMREEGLEVVYNKRRARGYSSYAGEVSKAPENLVNRRFRADEPNRLWLTDITEFRLPGGEKVYLSPIVDCFDGMPVAWSIGLHPDKRLANSSLLKACAARPAGARTTIHSDRGGHYRWPEWIGICEENGLVRSMSAKGCSPDNSACEGFFGRLKNEFFHYRDWEGVTAGEFMGRLEAYLVYYREERIKKSLGWLSPMEYRRKLGALNHLCRQREAFHNARFERADLACKQFLVACQNAHAGGIDRPAYAEVEFGECHSRNAPRQRVARDTGGGDSELATRARFAACARSVHVGP